MDISLGQVVLSRAGRDKGKHLVVVKDLDLNYVMVSDGDLRKIENPKKKKIKHLELTDTVFENIREKLKDNLRITNADIRKALKEIDGGT